MKAVAAIIALCTLLTSLRVEAQSALGDALRRDIDFAKSKVYPALVNIAVVTQVYSSGRAERFPAAGSGVIVSAAGHILTNFHVAGDTTRITCTLPSGERIDADVVSHDPLTDLSVLKLRLGERLDPNEPLPFATLGNSDLLQVGDYVLAMGNPLTLSSSLTLGVVSNTKRVFTDFTGTEISDQDLGDGEKTGIFTRWIQHDALILPGNSGGPLVNLRGEVVGINELGGSGVGFAIPSGLAAKVLNQVMTFGEVRRGWLGISVLPVDKLGHERGALVSSVVPTSPAHKKGLRPGDIVVRLGKDPVTVRFFEEVPVFYQHVADLAPGRSVKVVYLRDGTEHEVDLDVARMERFVGEQTQVRGLGATLREITAPMALARQMPRTDGVLVTGIRPGYPFEGARPALRTGDVVVSFGGEATPNLVAFQAAYAAAKEKKKTEIPVEILRDDESVVVVVEIKEEEDETRGGELPKAWLGARTQVLTPGVAKALGHEGTRGFRVTEVYPWTKAKEAGLQIGDLIVAVDGDKLQAFREQDAPDLQRIIEDFGIGDKIVFEIRRGNESLALTIEMQDKPAPSQKAKKSEQKEFEFVVREILFMDRVELKLGKDDHGLLVVDATNGGWASYAGLRVKDVLQSINGRPVHDVAGFEATMKSVLDERPPVVSLFVRRGPLTHFIFIEPVWSEVRSN
ncbi:MAG: PDZ domain-containing protein [Planctomycetota bacterium]